MARVRTIPQAVEEIRAKDPQTVMNKTLLRKMVKRGEIPCMRMDGRVLINLDRLEDALSGEA